MPLLLNNVQCEPTWWWPWYHCKSFKLAGHNCRHDDDVILHCNDVPISESHLKEGFEGQCLRDNNPDLQVLTLLKESSDDMTLTKCWEACFSGEDPFTYMGVENGRDCYCSNELNAVKVVPANECDMVCSGDSNEICGGKDRVNVYTMKGTSPFNGDITERPCLVEILGDCIIR